MAVALALPAVAATTPADRRLLRCADIARGDARLACYDDLARAAGATMVPASAANAATMASPDAPAQFGHARSPRAGSAASLTATIRSAARGADGRWRIVVTDGGAWRQVEADQPDIAPAPGAAIVIRRAALGSYFAAIGGRSGIRLVPVN